MMSVWEVGIKERSILMLFVPTAQASCTLPHVHCLVYIASCTSRLYSRIDMSLAYLYIKIRRICSTPSYSPMSKTATATCARNNHCAVWYTPEERTMIDPYKAQYVWATSPDKRKRIARFHILPSIFNF